MPSTVIGSTDKDGVGLDKKEEMHGNPLGHSRTDQEREILAKHHDGVAKISKTTAKRLRKLQMAGHISPKQAAKAAGKV